MAGVILVLIVLTGCALKKHPIGQEELIKADTIAKNSIIIIYNHGTRNPRKKERCKASYNQVPASLNQLANDQFLIYYLCSNATEGSDRKVAGNQVYARMFEIDAFLDQLIKRGVLPEHIFLAGHSKGAWASLMLMKELDKKFNAAILFAPALANRKSSQNYPWWRGEVRTKQIKQMLAADKIEALIFAYEDDEYNRAQDLQFLSDRYPDSVKIVSYRCDFEYTHNTHLHDCRLEQTKKLISHYIQAQIDESSQN